MTETCKDAISTKKLRWRLFFTFLILALSGCHPNNRVLEPNICYQPPQSLLTQLPAPFPPLLKMEKDQDWGKELFLGKQFAKEMDLYRSITCFKRALLLLPKEQYLRRLEIQYDIFLAYYMGKKFQEALDTFEGSDLFSVGAEFPAFEELLILLYEIYIELDLPAKACRILGFIASFNEERASDLSLSSAILEADLPFISEATNTSEIKDDLQDFLNRYAVESKSVSKAETFNTVLPGLGYYYVGQKKAALTSFIINTLFIAAAYQLFDRGYIAAGLITTSLEFGWYFGGINGAGLAAKEYNEQLYESLGKELLIKNRLFPVLMIQKGF